MQDRGTATSSQASWNIRQSGTVTRIDARDFRAEIISLFEANGKTEFANQFDWYYRDYGQQTPISWALRDIKGRLLGLCSVTIRTMRFGTTPVSAGIAGNLLVDRGRGAYLGAFWLVNAIKSLVDDSEVDLLLGIPNELAQPVFARCGFSVIDRWATFVQVANSRDLLSFHFGRSGMLASRVIDWTAMAKRRLSHWHDAKNSGFRVIDLSENEVNRATLEHWASPSHELRVIASGEYLKWRFMRAPAQVFSVAAISSAEQEICGYLVVRNSRGRIWIVDLQADHRQLTELEAMLCFCSDRRALASTVWIPVLSSTRLSQGLATSGFIKIKPSVGGYPEFPFVGYWRTNHPLARAFGQPSSWHLLSGFNDV
jgi:hypothetical protein